MKLTMIASAAALTLAGTAMADMYNANLDVEWDTSMTGEMVNHVFNLPAVASIDSISLDLAHTWGGDFDIYLTAPSGEVFTIMEDEIDAGGSGNFDMGINVNDGSLANVDTYTWVESGGLGAYDDTSGVAPGDTYNANTWVAGGFIAGDWTLSVSDDAGGDAGAVGALAVVYTVPAPGAFALLGLAGVAARRRRRG